MIAAVVVTAVVVKVLFLGNRPVRRPRENSDLQEHQVRARAGTGSRF